MATIPTNRCDCEALDAADPLTPRREQFVLPPGVIYLDGHSLGPATHAALARTEQAARQEWSQGLIRSWNDAGWIDLPLKVGARLAKLIGAQSDEVVVADNVSVNIFKLAAAALPLAKARTLLIEDDEFPTDQYIAEGVADIAGAKLRRVVSGEGQAALASHPGVLIKSAVNYRTARVIDMAAYEAAAAAAGAIILWDLSHAAGVLPVDVNGSGARIAVGCTYKYLNGGPGAPGYVYVRNDLRQMNSPISGWMGHAAPFAFVSGYEPRTGAARFASGTPGVLSLSALDGALDAFDNLDFNTSAAKARALGDLCLERAVGIGLATIAPPAAERGAHVSLVHDDGYAIVQALIADGVIADFRAPNVMRFGFAPLYVRYADVWDAMDKLAHILETRSWDQPHFKRRAAVT